MKALLKLIKMDRKNGHPEKSGILTPQEKIYEQTFVWKAHVGSNYFTI